MTFVHSSRKLVQHWGKFTLQKHRTGYKSNTRCVCGSLFWSLSRVWNRECLPSFWEVCALDFYTCFNANLPGWLKCSLSHLFLNSRAFPSLAAPNTSPLESIFPVIASITLYLLRSRIGLKDFEGLHASLYLSWLYTFPKRVISLGMSLLSFICLRKQFRLVALIEFFVSLMAS